jgi:hypothetical protein
MSYYVQTSIPMLVCVIVEFRTTELFTMSKMTPAMFIPLCSRILIVGRHKREFGDEAGRFYAHR